ncbi:unnamed protein product [Nippostrongylus brasiliensis]|uniref:NR LBD domain-containing protein n=1 Tax=Nippostrongylus brasiliensis TaxID=27835 RepID=A0A0N4YQB5_NIPBR|nr:unnamed protein product [Nippostrongylus brasiliensis]
MNELRKELDDDIADIADKHIRATAFVLNGRISKSLPHLLSPHPLTDFYLRTVGFCHLRWSFSTAVPSKAEDFPLHMVLSETTSLLKCMLHFVDNGEADTSS